MTATKPIHRANHPRAIEHTDTIGYYIRDTQIRSVLSIDETISLIPQAQAGDRDALARIVDGNLRLVITIAKRYVSRDHPFLDCIQAGNFGLLRAIEKFNCTWRNTFSTYASYWIRQSIARKADTGNSAIRLPAQVHLNKRKVDKATARLLAGDAPVTDEAICELAGITPGQLASVRKHDYQIVSLETLCADDPNHPLTLGSLITAPESTEEVATRHAFSEHLDEALDCLSDRERRVITLRYGIGSHEGSLTLAELSDRLGLTRERIRQIEKLALHKLYLALTGEQPEAAMA